MNTELKQWHSEYIMIVKRNKNAMYKIHKKHELINKIIIT